MKKYSWFTVLIIALTAGACKKFLDVVPDNAPIIDQAFNVKAMAERYLVTCYSRLPSSTSIGDNVGLLGADEFWLNSTTNYPSSSNPAWYIARGQQNSNTPLIDMWGDGTPSGAYWQGIYDCNIFIERIPAVPDMDEGEKTMWAAEAKFLKAYYHFLLVRAYGPIIIKDVNTPVFANPSESHVPRAPVDECFAYIVKTIDDAMPYLMPVEMNPNQEIGRITQVAAKAVKAQILVEAASPLYNGNTEMAALKDDAGNPLFNQVYDENKWVLAAAACKEAIDFAHANNKALERWVRPSNFTVQGPTTAYQMNLRYAITESDDNTEALWYDSKNVANTGFQSVFTTKGIPAVAFNNGNVNGRMATTLNMAEKFYSKNGVPIDEDKTYSYASRYDIVKVPNTDQYKYDLQANYTTIGLHLDREPRFYGCVSFDGGRHLMYSETSDAKAFNVNYKLAGGVYSTGTEYTITGYMVKKYVNPTNTYTESAHNARPYLLAFIRLADLYLLYSEALNESEGPGAEAYGYIDSVRARSGLKGVVESWATYSSMPAKPLTKEGLREIIKRERTNELAFEGKRFWDLRRWKDAPRELNEPILGWDRSQLTPQAFYRAQTYFNRTFTVRDYFWPISLAELRRNTKLKQNVGW
ncbi:RagB/SusD family nutrient uptake outer membrane protein [Niabella hirudinis]|uniref:RagB/SusD family nutrient uptake outer membrane protein n=1 Tax=Niabella hirudinis TaxID=1285929 RepID=UPI003EB8F0C2